MRPTRLILFLFFGFAVARADAAEWTDLSPHKVVRIQSEGLSLECLDWGGSGEALLLLAGLGSSAHIYDDFALKFTDRFRVVALTRRGLGQSDAAPAGYDMPLLTGDILHCLDALGIKQAVIVGHSFGAVEAAVFARSYPDRVSKLVYLDGAYTPSPERHELLQAAGRLMPSPTPDEAGTFAFIARLVAPHATGLERGGGGRYAKHDVRRSGRRGGPPTLGRLPRPDAEGDEHRPGIRERVRALARHFC